VILAEHGEHGSSAAPIAKHILETYLASKAGKPLPTFPVPAVPAAVVAPATPPAQGPPVVPREPR
jgi:hypothetical protein